MKNSLPAGMDLDLSALVGESLMDIDSAFDEAAIIRKSYQLRMQPSTSLSYSNRKNLRLCPKKWELDKITATGKEDEFTSNIDFAFGHAVGAGVATWIATQNANSAIFSSFLAYNTGFFDSLKTKSIVSAYLAVNKFIGVSEYLLKDWEIALFEGKPAVELRARIDLGNGYFFYMDIDVVLKKRGENVYKILECKTTSLNNIHESLFGNSSQALGYGIVLDSIAGELSSTAVYEVMYTVFKAGSAQEWEVLPFIKSRQQRAEWLQDVLMDCSIIDAYKEHNHFPKNGEACFDFYRPCQYYGTCGLANSTFSTKYHLVSDTDIDLEEREKRDIDIRFKYHINDLVDMQTQLINQED